MGGLEGGARSEERGEMVSSSSSLPRRVVKVRTVAEGKERTWCESQSQPFHSRLRRRLGLSGKHAHDRECPALVRRHLRPVAAGQRRSINSPKWNRRAILRELSPSTITHFMHEWPCLLEQLEFPNRQ